MEVFVHAGAAVDDTLACQSCLLRLLEKINGRIVRTLGLKSLPSMVSTIQPANEQ